MAAIIARPAHGVAFFLRAGLVARSRRDAGSVLGAAIDERL
ncbi:hypothetical protein ACFY00_13260 [Kitasatospora sp. NPDC001540]